MNQPIHPQTIQTQAPSDPETTMVSGAADSSFSLIQEKMVSSSEAMEELDDAPPKVNLWSEFLDALQRTFRVKPWVTLSSLWVILMVLGWMATAEIISPGNDQPKPRTPIAEAQREQSSSLGVLGAIGFSCATISIVLAQKFGQDRR